MFSNCWAQLQLVTLDPKSYINSNLLYFLLEIFHKYNEIPAAVQENPHVTPTLRPGKTKKIKETGISPSRDE